MPNLRYTSSMLRIDNCAFLGSIISSVGTSDTLHLHMAIYPWQMLASTSRLGAQGWCVLQGLHAFCKARGYTAAPDLLVNVSPSGPAVVLSVWGDLQPMTLEQIGSLDQSEFANLYSVCSCLCQ